MKAKIIVSTVLAASIALASWADEAADAVIDMRQEIMSGIGKSMKILAPMAKGEVEFNAEEANVLLETISKGAQEIPNLFPEGSMEGMSDHGHLSEAGPAIWEDPEGFAEITQKFIDDTQAAVDANPQSVEELGQTLGLFGEDCKACHEDFRVKRN